jgi:hypothetical protein
MISCDATSYGPGPRRIEKCRSRRDLNTPATRSGRIFGFSKAQSARTKECDKAFSRALFEIVREAGTWDVSRRRPHHLP